MLRNAFAARRFTQMSAGSGQVASALKCVLEKAAAAAQRSGKNTKVRHETMKAYIAIEDVRCSNKCQNFPLRVLELRRTHHGMPCHNVGFWSSARGGLPCKLCKGISCHSPAAQGGSSQQNQACGSHQRGL